MIYSFIGIENSSVLCWVSSSGLKNNSISIPLYSVVVFKWFFDPVTNLPKLATLRPGLVRLAIFFNQHSINLSHYICADIQ